MNYTEEPKHCAICHLLVAVVGCCHDIASLLYSFYMIAVFVYLAGRFCCCCHFSSMDISFRARYDLSIAM
jgi:hypothetical protein